MKKRHLPMPWFCTILLILAFLVSVFTPDRIFADDFSGLKGGWQCREEGLQVSLEFKSRNQLFYDGEAFSYQLATGTIMVQEEYGVETNAFSLEGGRQFAPGQSIPDGPERQ